ncbi:MAG: hypothetical protein IKT72_04685 [Clostridia bacterium]|nr:hypothetical protein [Clostridia bacterium]
MIVTFCGHARFKGSVEYEQKILSFLKETVADREADFYLGGYGDFDRFAYGCCKAYKKTHPKVSLVFVTPYRESEYLKHRFDNENAPYDLILYPELENKPKRYAITYRNRYMVEVADYIIAYVTHDWGGAYATYQHAKKKGKTVFNLAKFEK